MLGLTQNKIIGLDIDEGAVTACILARKASAPTLLRSASASSLGDMASENLPREAKVVIAIPAQVILFKTFYVPAALAKGMNRHKGIIAFLTRQSLPFKLDECYWDTFIWGNNLTFIAAKKEMVQRYITQVSDAGLTCVGVTIAASALYNVFILNYPEHTNDRSVVLHIRHSASDLVLYEPGHLWMYPLSFGRKDFSSSGDAAAQLASEIQRIFNAHTLQHAQVSQKTGGFFFVSASQASPELAGELAKHLPDFQLQPLNPLKKIQTAAKNIGDQSAITLAVGIGLSKLACGSCLSINMIRGRVLQEKSSHAFGLLRRLSSIAVTLCAVAGVLLNASLLVQLKQQSLANKKSQEQIASVLPQVKAIKLKQNKMRELEAFLEQRIHAQMVYLKVLATLAESKSVDISIKEFSGDKKDTQLEIALSGTASGYNDINDFLANLKKNPDIKNVKVVASTFPQGESPAKPIDFKVRFEVPL
jgi:type II secretory pathway component PulL